jgi:hypothetical protein
MADSESNVNPKYRRVRIPKQDFVSKKTVVRPSMDNSIVREIREVFDKFSDSNDVNPHTIKSALRSVSKIYQLIFFF